MCDEQGTSYSSCECSSGNNVDAGSTPLDSSVFVDANSFDAGENILDSALRDSGTQTPITDGGEQAFDSGSMTSFDAGNAQDPDTGAPLPDAGNTPLPDAGNTPGGNIVSVSGTGPASIPSSGSSGSLTTVVLAPSLIISDINIRVDLSRCQGLTGPQTHQAERL